MSLKTLARTVFIAELQQTEDTENLTQILRIDPRELRKLIDMQAFRLTKEMIGNASVRSYTHARLLLILAKNILSAYEEIHNKRQTLTDQSFYESECW